MILGALFKLIKNLVDWFSAICAFLLIKLKLWISAVFALLFIVICAFSGTELKGRTVNYFIGGVVACFLLAVVLNVLSYYRRHPAENRGFQNISGVKTKEASNKDLYRYSEPLTYSERPSKPDDDTQTPKRYNYVAYSEPENTAEKIQKISELNRQGKRYEDFADLKKKYFGDNAIKSDLPQDIIKEQPVQQSKNEALAVRQNQSFTDEKPRIFAMRSDSNVLIYEFSDRLEFYRKTKKGLVGERVEFKN